MRFIPITVKQIKDSGIPLVDYHIHADYADANLKIEDIFQQAQQKGLTQIAITEHIWKGAPWIEEYIEKIKKCNFTEKDYVLIGAEARVIDLNGDINIDPLEMHKFDFIIGVVHRYPIEITPELYSSQLSVKEAIALEEKALMAMIKKRSAHVVGHIGRALEKFFAIESFPSDSLRRIINCAKEFDVAVEINTASKNVLDVFRECLVTGCPMSFGTDAHSLQAIGSYKSDGLLEVFNNSVRSSSIFV